MAATTEQRTLRTLRDKLREDCVTLTDSRECDVTRDDGSITRHATPGLIQQLSQAIAHSGETRPVLRRKRGLPIVISVQAFDIMADIERVTKKWDTSKAIHQRIAHTVAELCREDTNAIPRMRIVSGYLDSWVRLIRELFEPPRRLHLAAPCPACTETTVTVYHADDRESVLAPALQITYTKDGHVCECYACGAIWPETHFLLLAQILGCESVVIGD